MFPSDSVKIFKNAFSLKCVTDFRMPLKPINMFFRKCDCFCITNGWLCQTSKTIWDPHNFIGMRSPDIDLFRVPGQNIIMFADIYLDRSITTSWPLLNIATEFCCDDMKTQADSQNRNPQVKIQAGIPGAFYCWSTPKYDSLSLKKILLTYFPSHHYYSLHLHLIKKG